MQETHTTTQVDYKQIATDMAYSSNKDVYVVADGGSYLYLGFDDDFNWSDVLFVAKKF